MKWEQWTHHHALRVLLLGRFRFSAFSSELRRKLPCLGIRPGHALALGLIRRQQLVDMGCVGRSGYESPQAGAALNSRLSLAPRLLSGLVLSRLHHLLHLRERIPLRRHRLQVSAALSLRSRLPAGQQ